MKTKITPEELAEIVLQDWLGTPSGRSAPNRTAEYLCRFFPGRSYGNVLAAIREASRRGLIEDTAWRANLRNWEPTKRYVAAKLILATRPGRQAEAQPGLVEFRHEPAEAA